MGAGWRRVLAGRGVLTVGLAALAAACGSVSAGSPPGAGQSPGTATPTVTPSAVPVLGPMTYGAFPATAHGADALTLCEQWAGLRGQYVSRVQADTPYQLEQWFSSQVWLTARTANNPLRNDPAYSHIDVAFGLAIAGEAASIASARWLDRACAAAD
jgi:hypothetical protein